MWLSYSLGSQSRDDVPEHRLLRHSTSVESEAMPSQVARPGGSQLALTVVDPPTSMVVAEAFSQPRDAGVGVGVAVAGLAVGLGGVTGSLQGPRYPPSPRVLSG